MNPVAIADEKTVERIIAKRQKRDSKEIIRMVMATPLKDEGEYGPVVMPDGKMSIAELSKKNLDVQTRIYLTMAGQATSGDVKSAEFLMKYGGLTPPAEQTVNINLPRIVNDIEFKQEEEEKALEAAFEVLEAPKEEEEDVGEQKAWKEEV